MSSVIIGDKRGDILSKRSSAFEFAPEMSLTQYSLTNQLLVSTETLLLQCFVRFYGFVYFTLLSKASAFMNNVMKCNVSKEKHNLLNDLNGLGQHSPTGLHTLILYIVDKV